MRRSHCDWNLSPIHTFPIWCSRSQTVIPTNGSHLCPWFLSPFPHPLLEADRPGYCNAAKFRENMHWKVYSPSPIPAQELTRWTCQGELLPISSLPCSLWYKVCNSANRDEAICWQGHISFFPATYSKNQILPAGICLPHYLLSKGSVLISSSCLFFSGSLFFSIRMGI